MFSYKSVFDDVDMTKVNKEWADTSVKHASLVLAHAKTDDRVRELTAIVKHPVFAGSEFLLTAPGWNPQTGILYQPTPELVGIEPMTDLDQVRGVLDDLAVDFPFDGQASRQNFLGALITPFVFPAISSLAPMFVIDASTPGSGKSILAADVLGRIVTGSRLLSSSLISDHAELRKQLTSILLSGRRILLFDNIGHHVDSPVLARFLTEPLWSDRILGVSQNFQAEHRCLTIGTANNFSCSDEIGRRVIPIRLEPNRPDPENRPSSDFKHPNLVEFVTSVRPKAIAAILGLAESWKAAGSPRARITLGSYEDWTEVVGGILEHAGYDQFLANRRLWADSASSIQEEDINLLVQTWSEKIEVGSALPAKDLVDLLEPSGAFPDILSEPAPNQAKKLGKRLKRYEGRIIGRHTIRSRKSGGRSMWRLERDILPTPEPVSIDLDEPLRGHQARTDFLTNQT